MCVAKEAEDKGEVLLFQKILSRVRGLRMPSVMRIKDQDQA
jgi:hypothetical protein